MGTFPMLLARAAADRRLHFVWLQLPACADPLGSNDSMPRVAANDGFDGPKAA